MQCPVCRQECGEKEFHTFTDYAEALCSAVCIQGNELVKGNLSEAEKEDLKLIIKCAELVSKRAFNFDLNYFKFSTVPKKEQSNED